MKVGDLVKFGFIYNGSRLNNKTAIYLGKNFLTREDSIVIRNHKVMITGDSEYTIIDQRLLQYMRVLSA